MKKWPLQDAKAKFSAVIEKAIADGPQTVTRRGREVVVIVSMEKFQKMSQRGGASSLVTFFRESPLQDLPADTFQRDNDRGREVDL